MASPRPPALLGNPLGETQPRGDKGARAGDCGQPDSWPIYQRQTTGRIVGGVGAHWGMVPPVVLQTSRIPDPRHNPPFHPFTALLCCPPAVSRRMQSGLYIGPRSSCLGWPLVAPLTGAGHAGLLRALAVAMGATSAGFHTVLYSPSACCLCQTLGHCQLQDSHAMSLFFLGYLTKYKYVRHTWILS
ncbi:hypothetical protein ACOMHN_066069 [Nucella lapillus]